MEKSKSSSLTDMPRFGRLVESVEEFYNIAKHIAHFAVKRSVISCDLYFHHYIVAGWLDEKKKIIEYFSCFKNFLTGPGQVAKNDISENEIKKAIADKKLYVIEAPGYPQNEDDSKKAKDRFLGRLGEQAYSLASNNCEHLVNYILTGIPYSDQIMKAGVWKKLFVDSFDNIVCYGKRNMLKLSGCTVAALPLSVLGRIALSEIPNVAAGLMSNPASNSAGKFASNLCKTACKNSKSELFAAKKCINVTKAASKEALLKTAGTTFIITGLVEGGMAAYEIYKFRKQCKEGAISKRDFHREVTKSVSGAVSATVGTVAGGVVGQAIIPIPVLGFAIGSALGNYFGRWFGSAVSGQVFDLKW